MFDPGLLYFGYQIAQTLSVIGNLTYKMDLDYKACTDLRKHINSKNRLMWSLWED